MVSAPGLTLRHFLLKQKVLNLYRSAIRASRGVIFRVDHCRTQLPNIKPHPAIQDPVARRETLAWVRSEFEHNQHITDVVRPWSLSCDTYLSKHCRF